jgi:hypothetical protein
MLLSVVLLLIPWKFVHASSKAGIPEFVDVTVVCAGLYSTIWVATFQ